MDPISDMLIRIKNAQRAGHEAVQVPYSKFKNEIAKTLERARLIGGVERKGKRVRKMLEISLLYAEGTPKVREVEIVSKPSRRLYIQHKNLWKPRHGGSLILSTPKGVMTSFEARKAKVGGQLIAEVW